MTPQLITKARLRAGFALPEGFVPGQVVQVRWCGWSHTSNAEKLDLYLISSGAPLNAFSPTLAARALDLNP